MELRFFTGISDANLAASGWNVICNGGGKCEQTNRELLVGMSQLTDFPLQLTISFPGFRGYVFLRVMTQDLYPGILLKSGIDAESRVYQAAKLDMIGAIRQVIDFLNKLDSG